MLMALLAGAFVVVAQAAPEPTPAPTGGSSGGGPGIDIGALANGIVNGILQGLGDTLNTWLTDLGRKVAEFLRDTISNLWNGLWSSGANVLNTPSELTIDFGPAQFLGFSLGTVVYAVAVLAIVLLGLRIMWRNLTGAGGALTDAVDGVLLGFFLAAVSSVVLIQAFKLTRLASDAIGRLSYAPMFDPHTLLSIGPDFALAVFTLLVLMIYGWRLFRRAAYRIVLLMFLSPLAPIAGILWAIPQVRWVSVLYWVVVGGWLAGGFLAIGAVSLAVQLSTVGNTNGVLSLLFGVALLEVAYDLMGMLPKGGGGGIQVGSPFSALIAGMTGGAVGAAAVSAGAMSASATGGGGVAGALPSGGDMPGFGYE